MGWWPSSAVTFLDNQDTGSTFFSFFAKQLALLRLPNLFHTGIFFQTGILFTSNCQFNIELSTWCFQSTLKPVIFFLYSLDRLTLWGEKIFTVGQGSAFWKQSHLYGVGVGKKPCMRLRDVSWYSSGREWTLATSGHGFTFWHK